MTNQRGEFTLALPPGPYTLSIVAGGFIEKSERLVAAPSAGAIREFVLDVAGPRETVNVSAPRGYRAPAVASATKTVTPLRDVPQSVSVVTSTLIADQRMQSMADVVRYMPGVGMAQGEGNRDTPILRGNSSTSDFFVDGIRDDVQYFRDLYNVERVEALKGPNAMIFGRGGVGGVINRVTRQADWGQSREASLQVGSWDNRRFTVDVGQGLNETVGGARHRRCTRTRTSYRDGVGIERYGFNPTVAFRARAEHDAARRLRVLPRRAHRRPRHLVVQRPAGRDRSRRRSSAIPARSPTRCHGQRCSRRSSSTGSRRASRCATA